MKHSYLNIVIAAFLIQFLISSCDFFTFQDTAMTPLIGLWELKETLDTNGKIVTGISSNVFPPFVFRDWFGYSQSQQPIDSLYFMKNRGGDLIEKWALKESIKYTKHPQRHEYLLSNGKYIYFELGMGEYDGYMIVSEIVSSPTELGKDLKRGIYFNIADKPDNW